MNKTAKITICLLFLIFNISNIFIEGWHFAHKDDIEIVSKNVWITSNVDSIESGSGSNYYNSYTRYFVRYDDHNGETGLLDTDSNGNNLTIGDIVTVYRSSSGYGQSDSTHGWCLSVESAKAAVSGSFGLFVFSIFTVINIIILICCIQS